MMKYLNARVWLLVLGAMMVVGGVANILGAEDIATDQWTGAAGRELDIATGLEVAWGLKIVLIGVAVVLVTLLTHGAAQARFGAVTTVTFVIGEISTVSYLESKGYGEDASMPWAMVLIPALLVLITLIACLVHWNGPAETEPAVYSET
ncbi:MAG: hypothetical protein HOM37_08540 [Acidimicrobiaceae bacterium]|jgi:hypothetical protein|nr:hypothetical protein [Acidimicrobiaceae bacterium]MBT5580829.1 hypothetical protein [Acidimicrobiaceae bacterium]MDG2219285.1 hypothetical protein [Acidimicrobiales bacterium]